MDIDTNEQSVAETLEIAMSCVALFEQYDDAESTESANDDWYENLYPNIA